MTRLDGRRADEMRPIRFVRGFTKYAEGSVLSEFGNTRVLCNASVQDRVPAWSREQRPGEGWITAEYAMLPRATGDRSNRERDGKVSGRTQEIQRLIGRSLRMAVDLAELGERTITLDCDVLQADGGTRTAAITGAWIALHDALEWMVGQRMLKSMPRIEPIAAVSVGMFRGDPVLDLCYLEDREAGVDGTVVMTGSGDLIELGFTAEGRPLALHEMQTLLDLAHGGLRSLWQLQREALRHPVATGTMP
ncbi:MAG: ribonuclease PH [Candidatus Sericytochromatia bacterium]|nr:ribonuclease PH [Candidatus Sericytochromatia bacterium]